MCLILGSMIGMINDQQYNLDQEGLMQEIRRNGDTEQSARC